MNDDRSTQEVLAEKWGRETGANAAEWAIAPDRLSKEQMLGLIAGIEDGDPQVMDLYHVPDLNGDQPDDTTQETLCDALGLDGESDMLEVCAEAWEAGATAAFWEKLGDILRYHTAEEA
jgi:hypothetical protein